MATDTDGSESTESASDAGAATTGQISSSVVRRRRSPLEVDQLRARALLGDPLTELRDGEREWVWRSLLKGVRVEQAALLASLSPAEVALGLERILGRYHERAATYKSSRDASAISSERKGVASVNAQ